MKNSVKPFVIITMVRCGSYYLSTLLDSASDIRCLGEVFKKNEVEMSDVDLRCLGIDHSNTGLRNRLGVDFLDHVVSLTPRKITGFKAFLDHFFAAGMSDFVESNSWKKIFLTRNVVEQYVSLERAKMTGIYTLFHGEQIDRTVLEQKIHFDRSRFEKFLAYRMDVDFEFARLQRKLGRSNFEIVDYSDLQDARHILRILRFVGSDAQVRDLHSDRRKQFLRPLHEGVENFEELYQYLIVSGQRDLLPAAYKRLGLRLKMSAWRKRAA